MDKLCNSQDDNRDPSLDNIEIGDPYNDKLYREFIVSSKRLIIKYADYLDSKYSYLYETEVATVGIASESRRKFYAQLAKKCLLNGQELDFNLPVLPLLGL